MILQAPHFVQVLELPNNLSVLRCWHCGGVPSSTKDEIKELLKEENLMVRQENLFTGEGALPLAQWSISFLISCSYLFFQQLSFESIDNCTSGSAPSPV